VTGSLWLDIPAISLAALWLILAVLVRRARRALDPVASWSEPPPAGGWPRVSVVVPCRDEAPHVRGAMESLLALDYPDLEVIAVDDRSTDGTREALEAMAAEHRKLRVVRIDEIPPGWLGKCNALREGSLAARGEWLLFMDGDVRLHPLVLKRAVARAEARGLDLLSFFPQNEARSIWMRSFQTMLLVFFIMWMGLWAHTRRKQSLVAMCAGAFALVRRRAYERAGGHEPIRLAVIDDLHLGHLIRRTGGRTEVGAAADWLSVPYAPTVGDLFRVTRKNHFALFWYSWTFLAFYVVAGFVSQTLAPLLFVVDIRLWPCAVAVWLALWDIYRVLAPLTGVHPAYVVLHPIVTFITLLPGVASAIAVTREGGVSWKGSFYPLAELRGTPGAGSWGKRAP
jgi:cellulose synthase/poly-beta-1,6-N-acetylglucosamine synthase-like glycosyltransferase